MANVYQLDKYSTKKIREANDRILLAIIICLVLSSILFGIAIGARLFSTWINIIFSSLVFSMMLTMSFKGLDKYTTKYTIERRSWIKGNDGESVVAEELKKLPNSYYVFNNLRIDNFDIDHVIVGPSGILIIETKNSYGTIEVREGNVFVKGVQAVRNPANQAKSNGMTLREKIGNILKEKPLFESIVVYPFGQIINSNGIKRVAFCNEETLLSNIEKRRKRFSFFQIRKYQNAIKIIACI